ncbi:Penicillin-insensitive murein endopeptidase [Gammaproteobacteria bacterium]
MPTQLLPTTLDMFPNPRSLLRVLQTHLFRTYVLLVVLPICAAPLALANDWGNVTQPSHARPEVIGGPAAGCLNGAVNMPPEGHGYQLMRLSRHRTYGHPSLVHFLRTLGEALEDQHLGVMLVGDLGQPRGGPTASLHRSHQNGLDVDIWYWLPEVAKKRRLNPDEVENLSAPSMVKDRRVIDHTRWTPAHVEMLRLAVAPDEVERIFVHPVIKKTLCEQETDRDWLHKVRPWWGHDDHLHVRLRCPPDDDLCASQKPLPPGDGCGADLEWWLEAVAAAPTTTHPPRPPAPVLPAACAAVLRAP